MDLYWLGFGDSGAQPYDSVSTAQYPKTTQTHALSLKIVSLINLILIINDQTDMNERRQGSAQSDGLQLSERSSFKQLIRDVQNLINQEDDIHSPISNFDADSSRMTNGQKLELLMKSPAVRGKLTEFLRQVGYLELYPVLKARIFPTHVNYELQQKDLEDVFRRFGEIDRIIFHNSEIFVFFIDHISAYFAAKCLGNLQLEPAGTQLIIEWCKSEDYGLIGDYLSLERNLKCLELKRNGSSNNSKFTCRYEIQIDNDKEFQVARRIIGSKGCNMKNIIDMCLIEVGTDPKIDPDSIKLRLRGRGSGYREGVNKTQSDDPLHLCVSCRDESAYNKACKLVEELLKSIYEDYRAFCQRGFKPCQQISVKKLDFNFASRRQQLENYDYSAVENERMTESDIRMYIEARNKARRELNFGEADNIRNYLKSKGITLIDEKGGRGRGVEVTTWRYCN